MSLGAGLNFYTRRREAATGGTGRELVVLSSSSSASSQEPLSVERAIRWIRDDPIEAMNDFNVLLGSPDKLSSADHFKALMGRAEVLLVQGSLSSAREDALKALQILDQKQVQFIGVPWKRAESYRYLARIYIAENKTEEARSQFEMGYKICRTHQELAKQYISFESRQQNTLKALQICDEMIQAIPDGWDFFYQRAKLHFAVSKWPQAHQDCTVFLRNKESQVGYRKEVLDLGAKACLEMKNYKQASHFMEEAWLLENTPLRAVARSREVLDIRLLACMEEPLKMDEERWNAIEKSPEAALEVFDGLLKVDREPSDLLDLLLGRAIACIALERQENYLSARQNLEQVRAHTDSLSPEAKKRLLRWSAQLSIQQHKTDEALNHFQAWYSFDRVGSAAAYLKFLENNREEPSKIAQLCDEILQSHPQHIAALYHRIHALFALGKWAEVRRDAEVLLKLDMKGFSRLQILDLCAEACLKLGDCVPAYKQLQEAYLLETSSIVLERPKKLKEVYGMCESHRSSSSPLKPPEENFTHLVNCASKNKKPREGIEILDYVLRFRDQLSPKDLYFALFARAIHCINTEDVRELASARQNLNEAFKLGPLAWNPDQSVIFKGRILRSLAHIDALEKNPQEASEKFKEAWKVYKSLEILEAYLDFLQKRGEHKAAIQVCSQVSHERAHVGLLKMTTYMIAQEWESALQIFHSLAAHPSLEKAARIEFFSLASEACLGMQDYEGSVVYARQACGLGEFEGVPSFMERMRDLLKAKKALAIDQHFSKLSSIQSVAHATALLTTYEKELGDFPKHHVRLLALRAELLFREKKWDEAYEDDAEILRIFEDQSDFLLKKEWDRIEAASKGRAKQYFEAFLARVPNPYTFVNGEDYERVLQLFKDHPKLFSKKDCARVDALVQAAKKAEVKRVAAEKKSSS